ncbi:MAG: PKD domain-containing protein, partial [Bacteroidia bacterium]
MTKKILLLLVFFTTSIFVKAQITSIEYPSGYLSEEKITQILENSRKNGTPAWELQQQNEMLHTLLKKQTQDIANGTFNNSYGQKIIQTPPQVMQACTNPGFEDGTTNGWVLNQGSNSSGAALPCPTCITTGGSGGVYEVTTIGVASGVNSNAGNNVGGDASASCICAAVDCAAPPYNAAGTDYFGGFSCVAPAPLGGTHSLMLNNANCGYLMQQAVQSFVVSASNVSFTFQYAVVLQDGGHPANAAPYFDVQVTDVATGTLVPCAQYSASATGATSGNLNGWTASGVDASVFYKPWSTVSLNLSSMVGRTVAIAFTVSDCNQSGHFGYAYIDASCNPLQITKLIPLCPGQSAVLSGPPGMASYSWQPGGATTQNLTTSTVGNYTLTTTLATGCPSPTLYYNLTQDPNPVPTFSTSSPPCSGALAFTDGSTVAAPDTITDWVWNFGDGSPVVDASSGAAQNHAYTTPGAYTVTLTDTTNNHCVASYSFVVHAGGGGPNPSFSSNSPATTPQCLAGNNVVFTNSSTATGSVTITGYDWDFGDGSATVATTTTSPNTSHTYAASGTYVVTLTVNVAGCSSTITQTVVISPMPTATISAPPVCLGAATVFTSTITNGSTYNWDYGDGGAAAVGSATPTHTYATANTFAVTMTVTSAAPSSCTVTATTNVIVSPVPTAAFTVAPVCMGAPSVFDATASTPAVGGTYSWSFGGAAPNTDMVTVQTDNHTYPAAGTFPVTLVVSVGTCSATATGNAVVNPNATAAISTTPVCLGAATVFTSTITNGTGNIWNFGDGPAAPGPAAPTHTYATAGNYTVSVLVSATGGCTATATTIAVVHPVPTAVFTVAQVCQGTGSVFNNTSTLDSACAWNFGGAGNPGTANSNCAPTFTYSAAGTFPVTLTVTATGGCTATTSGTAVVNAMPVLSFNTVPACDLSPIVINNTTPAQGTFTVWAWDFGDHVGT